MARALCGGSPCSVLSSIQLLLPGHWKCQRKGIIVMAWKTVVKKGRYSTLFRAGVPNLRDLMPDELRWNWCNNNRNKVDIKYNALESSPHSSPWKNCLLWSRFLVLKRLGATSLGNLHVETPFAMRGGSYRHKSVQPNTGRLLLELFGSGLHGDLVIKTSASNAWAEGSIPVGRPKIPHILWPKNQNIKQKQYCNKFNKTFKKWSAKYI